MSTRTFTGVAALGAAAALFLPHAPALGQAAGPGDAPLTLPAAVGLALGANPSAQAAAQQLLQAQARVAQALAGRRLQITFNSTASGSNANVIQPPPSQESFYTLQNTLTVPLPIGPKTSLAVRQAQALALAAQSQYTSARLGLAGQVGTAYYDLLRKQALLQLAQETVAQNQRQLDETRRRNAAGDVPDLDVIRAQVPVALAQAQQIGAESDVAVARQTLNSLIGRPLDGPLAVADVTPDATALPLTLEDARARALAFSPDVRAAQATITADQAALAASRRYGDPTYSVQAIDIRSNDQTSFSRVDTLQAAVTVPLSDGGLGRAQTREAEAALAGARAQESVARRAALAAVSAAFLTAQSARRQVTAAQIARDIAQVSYDKTVLGYQNKLFSLSDVLNAQTALTQARIAYTQAVYNAAIGVAGLNAALNGGALNAPGGGTGPAAPGPSTPGIGGAGAGGTGAGGNSGTSPAGAGSPGTTPAGNSTTGTSPGVGGGTGGANPGGSAGGANPGGGAAAGRGGP